MPIESDSADAGAGMRRGHRGPHPADGDLFAADAVARLRLAVAELSWLLSRGYAMPSALALVGDRHALPQRQRLAVSRAACTDHAQTARRSRQIKAEDVQGQELAIDGFNVLITIEAALGGGVLLLCRDGCMRDMSSVHGSYRTVSETERALKMIGESLAELAPRQVLWWLDQPISNSGRLATTIRTLAERRSWPWEVQVAFNPDAELARTAAVVASSDSVVLDRCGRWVNLSGWIVERHVPQAWTIALAGEP